jgi:hypothetical protein
MLVSSDKPIKLIIGFEMGEQAGQGILPDLEIS